jgi:hypothetical protein
MAERTIPIQSEQQVCETERRAWVRVAKEREVWCQPVSASSKEELDVAWLGRIRDISPDGIGLNMSRRFETETELMVELAEGPKVLRQLVAHVVHATLETNGRWTIGCTFDRALSPEEMEIILAK